MRDWVRVHTDNIAMVHGSRRAGDVLYREVEALRMDEEVGFDLSNGREDEFCLRVFSHMEGGHPRDQHSLVPTTTTTMAGARTKVGSCLKFLSSTCQTTWASSQHQQVPC